jgi:hypothetical protein
MTFRKAPVATDPVITDMIVYNSSQLQQGATTVFATSPLLASSDLHGNGYVWITVWQNGFAADVLGLDNQRTGVFSTTGSNFRDVRRPGDINVGNDLAGGGHPSINFTGSSGAAGDTWITVYDETPLDNSVQNLYGSVSLSADVLIHPFNNKKGAGLLALYNESPATAKGLALIVFDAGNTDTLVLNTVDQAGKLTALMTVPLGAGIAENVWYRVTMDVAVTGTSVTVTGTVTKHTTANDPNSGLDGQVGTLTFNANPLPTGVTSPGEIGIIAAATSAVVDSSVTNFTHTP